MSIFFEVNGGYFAVFFPSKREDAVFFDKPVDLSRIDGAVAGLFNIIIPTFFRSLRWERA